MEEENSFNDDFLSQYNQIPFDVKDLENLEKYLEEIKQVMFE
jgi:hypothetical protein